MKRKRRTSRYHAAEQRGRLAELLCRLHLRLRGWRIVARNWRCPAGEIDLIARRGRTLAVIEVKARPVVATAAAALSPRQRRRIVRAAAVFVAARPDLATLELRFDMMLVSSALWPRHWPAAWRADD